MSLYKCTAVNYLENNFKIYLQFCYGHLWRPVLISLEKNGVSDLVKNELVLSWMYVLSLAKL